MERAMNFFSAFQSEVFRPLVTILIPGGLAASSWIIFVLWKFPALKDLIGRNHTETAWILVLLITAIGLVIEDWGARIETVWDRAADRQSDGEHTRTWHEYLRCAFVADPIGRRYTRSVVLRLKFELGTACGCLIAALGLVGLVILGLNCGTGLVLIVLSVVFAGWQIIEAKDTHALLAITRKELLQEIRIVAQ
jgi:hypothetical protein